MLRVTQIWLLDPFTPVKSAVRAHDKNNSAQISNQGAQADLKMFKHLRQNIHKYLIFLTTEYKIYLKILQKLRCLMAFQNRPGAPIGRDENVVYFEFLEGQFYKEKRSFVWRFTFPSVCFSGVFLTLKCETLVSFTIT